MGDGSLHVYINENGQKQNSADGVGNCGWYRDGVVERERDLFDEMRHVLLYLDHASGFRSFGYYATEWFYGLRWEMGFDLVYEVLCAILWLSLDSVDVWYRL